jgi:hypothetical protein
VKKLALVVFGFGLLGAGRPLDLGPLAAAGEDLSTDRRVHGVITSVETAKLTIATQQHAVTGKIDPARTRVTINGKPGRLADLQITAHAKGELCLDDTWLVIDTH